MTIQEELHKIAGATRDTIALVRAERQRVEAGSALPAIVAADCAYLDFFIDLFEEAALQLESIDAEVRTMSPGRRQAGRLRQLAGRASDARRRCLEFFDSISLDIRNQLVALQELEALADRIDPKTAAAIDRRTLFTRFFSRPRARS